MNKIKIFDWEEGVKYWDNIITYKVGISKMKPVNAVIEPTHRCNWSCLHCWTKKCKSSQPELTFEEIASALDQLADMGVLKVDFTGGEPLIRDDFLKIARYARKRHFVINHIMTNASLITDKMADGIALLYPIAVQCTFLGTAKTHDSITGVAGSFDNMIKGIELLKKRKINVDAQMIALKPNFNEIDATVEIINELQINFVRPSVSIIPRIDGDMAPYKYAFSEQQLREFYLKVYKENPPKIKSLYRCEVNGIVCSAGTATIAIGPYGEVMGCTYLRTKGNLRSASISKIWLEDKVLNEIRRMRYSDMPVCKDCDMLRECGLCPGKSFSVSRSLTDAFEPSCVETRAKVYAKKKLNLI